MTKQVGMPTVFTLWGFRFFFYADEHLPVHIHVERGGARAKYNVMPVIALVENRGFKYKELRQIEAAIEKYQELIIDNWNAFHGE